jgi:dienelactone hydrolase
MNTQTNLVTIPVADGTLMDAAVVQPTATGPWPGILYPFESYGVTDHMVQNAAKTAAQGYVVIVPDLYHRLGRLLTGPYWEFEGQRAADLTHPVVARVLMWQLKNDEVFDDMDAARDYLKGLPTVRADCLAAIGSWMGARIALFYATLRPEIKALVQLYGGGAGSINHWEDYLKYLSQTGQKPPTDPTPAANTRIHGVVMDHISKLEAPVLFMWTTLGLTRESRSSDQRPVEDALRKLGKPFETHDYPNARVGFDNPNMPDAYNAEYARDAWERTFAFLQKHLGGGSQQHAERDAVASVRAQPA